MTILISIVGKQTIPNVLFIKEMKKVDKYIFITTSKMRKENKTKSITESAGISVGDKDIFEVPAFDLVGIEEALHKSMSKYDKSTTKYIVNITGGTKLMALVAYQYFSKKNAEIYYLPIPEKVYQSVHPVIGQKKALTYQLDLSEYLKATEVQLFEYGHPNYSKAQADTFYNNYQNLSHHGKFNRLFKNRNRKETYMNENHCPHDIANDQTAQSFLSELGFEPQKPNIINLRELRYIKGAWFEEYIYHVLATELGLTPDSMWTNIEIQYDNVKNEYDIIFVYNNSFHIIECKTGVSGEGEFNTVVEKFKALSEYPGALDVHGTIFILQDFKNITDLVRDRANQFKIKLMDKNDIQNSQAMADYIESIKHSK